MNRRDFLATLALLPVLPTSARAEEAELSIGIFPGTGTADMLLHDFRTAVMPFAQALAAPLGVEPRIVMFRTIKSTIRSLEKGRLDLYFAPPTVAVSVLDNGYTPVARVKDFINFSLIRRKGATVKTVALTEKESLPDVLGRYVLKQNGQNVEFMNVKTQDEVILAMDRDHAQAGALNAKLAQELVAKGTHEVWYPLPSSPGFTLMASDRLTDAERDKLGAAAVAVKAEVLQQMQKAFTSKLGGFVVDRQADFRTLKVALKDAGY